MKKSDLNKKSDCRYCIHLDKNNMRRCEAFPIKIPFDIISGEFDHNKEHDGDNGIRFEIDEEKLKREEEIQKILSKERE